MNGNEPRVSMLESARDYAAFYEAQENGVTINGMCARIFTVASGIKHCCCNGGLPMIKPDCPKHGYLAKNHNNRH